MLLADEKHKILLAQFFASSENLRRFDQRTCENKSEPFGHDCCRKLLNLMPGWAFRPVGPHVERLTLTSTFQYSGPLVMKKRLASLFLFLALAASTFAGVPPRFGESECNMAGMMHMGCCKAARLLSETPKVTTARLCCALNCAQSGTTSPPNVVRASPPSFAHVSSHPAITQPLPHSSLLFRHIDRLHGPPGSSPAYLRNLALLI